MMAVAPVMIMMFCCVSLETRAAPAQSAMAPKPYIYCGKTFRSMILFQKPDFQSAQIAPLNCGEAITLLVKQGYWAKIRTQSGLVGYEPTWFIGPPHVSTPSKSVKCNRPSPLDNVDQFERLSAIFDGFIDAENFTPEDLRSISQEDTKKLAADSYFAAYLTAENPGLVKEAMAKAVIDDRIFGKDFANLTPIQRINVEIWLQKLLDVISKSIDLGFQDGSKYPCSPK